jgi:methionyl-tRNA synthetase
VRHPQLALRRGSAAASDADQELGDAAARALHDSRAALDDFALHQALASIWELVGAANRYADSQQPWTLSRRAKTAKTPEASADLLAQLAHVSWHLLEALRVIAVLLTPFLPDATRAILTRLGVSHSAPNDLECARFGLARRFSPSAGPPLFPRLATQELRLGA